MVKKFLLAIIVLTTLASCKSEQPIYWDTLSINVDDNGTEVDINYPYRFGGDEKISAIINAKISQTLVAPLCGDEVSDTISVDSMITNVIITKQNDTILNRLPYQLNSSCDVYSAAKFTSVMLAAYYFTGGANGYNNVFYLNFDNQTGEIIPIEKLIDLTPELLQEVRKKFCLVREISITATESEAKMFIPPSELPFPKEIGFNTQGVVFFYNLYEVGPRYSGSTEVIIPYDKVNLLMQ